MARAGDGVLGEVIFSSQLFLLVQEKLDKRSTPLKRRGGWARRNLGLLRSISVLWTWEVW